MAVLFVHTVQYNQCELSTNCSPLYSHSNVPTRAMLCMVQHSKSNKAVSTLHTPVIPHGMDMRCAVLYCTDYYLNTTVHTTHQRAVVCCTAFLCCMGSASLPHRPPHMCASCKRLSAITSGDLFFRPLLGVKTTFLDRVKVARPSLVDLTT